MQIFFATLACWREMQDASQQEGDNLQIHLSVFAVRK